MATKRFYPATRLAPIKLTGTWAYVLASDLTSFDHTAAAETTTLTFDIPRGTTYSMWSEAISNISLAFTVGTAALTSAPTVTVNLVSLDATTRVASRTAVTATLTFAGTDTTGASTGTYSANIAISPTFVAENQSLTVEVVFVCAATTVLKTQGCEVTYT